MTTPQEAPVKSFSIVRHIVFASFVMVFLVGGLGTWAATANLAGAVIAPGTFVVERNVKKVQHSYGGIVSRDRRQEWRSRTGRTGADAVRRDADQSGNRYHPVSAD